MADAVEANTAAGQSAREQQLLDVLSAFEGELLSRVGQPAAVAAAAAAGVAASDRRHAHR